MTYTRLGNSDLSVSRICMGCMGFGDAGSGQHSWTLDEEHSRKIIREGLERGINFFDTAIALSLIHIWVIENRTDILPAVDSLVYEQEMGLSGWVSGRRVLVGNRRLLENHGVDVPSRDYESRYTHDGRELVYPISYTHLECGKSW